jgi:hypothetical protein
VAPDFSGWYLYDDPAEVPWSVLEEAYIVFEFFKVAGPDAALYDEEAEVQY